MPIENATKRPRDMTEQEYAAHKREISRRYYWNHREKLSEYHRQRRAAHPEKYNTEKHREYNRVYEREYRAWLKKHGFCSACGRSKAPAGYLTCEVCRAKQRERSKAQRERRNEKLGAEDKD